MNPFQLHGFSFLLFYLVVGVITLVGLRTMIRRQETADARKVPQLADPYLIATLRAGANEAMRVATVALLDRKLLLQTGEEVKSKSRQAQEMVQRPLEKAILKKFQSAASAHEVFKDRDAVKSCEGYRKVLASYGLIADSRVYGRRAAPVMVALVVLCGVAMAKVNIALAEGRHNIGFLLALAAVFSLFALYWWFKRLTAPGEQTIDDLKTLFGRLKKRSATLPKGGETNEVAMLAGVFGLSALSASDYPFLEKLYPSKSGDGSGCGSSSSCSSGSSCGGGCGGGGCGG